VLEASNFVLLTAPRRLYDMLPMAALIGCLIGLGSLASSSELTIMRAAGVSIGRIVWAVMKPMLVLMLVGADWRIRGTGDREQGPGRPFAGPGWW
jgi:lipopolysaccharide export system permease protein